MTLRDTRTGSIVSGDGLAAVRERVVRMCAGAWLTCPPGAETLRAASRNLAAP